MTEQHPWRLERQAQRAINAFKELDPDVRVEVDHPAKLERAPRNGFILSVLEPPHEVLSDVLGVWISQRRGTEKALIRKDAFGRRPALFDPRSTSTDSGPSKALPRKAMCQFGR